MALHAGDSRLYRIRGRNIQQITKDHSAAAMIGAKNEAEINPMFRGMILRAVGIQPAVELERTALPLKPGDWVLICSDGLSRMVPDKNIVSIVREVETPDDGVRKLISAANNAGGIDNITAILIKVGDFPQPVTAFPLVLEELSAPATSPSEPSDAPTCETSESMTFGSVSSDDPVTGSVTEPAMTFDEASQEDETNTRETVVSALVAETSASRGGRLGEAPLPDGRDKPADTEKPQRRNMVVVAIAAAIVAALLAVAATWFCMRGTGGAGESASGQETR